MSIGAMNVCIWTLSVVFLPKTFAANHTTLSPPDGSTEGGGLQSADVAAIVLGILLLLLLAATATICFLYYKGYLGRHPEEQATVQPVLRRISTKAIAKARVRHLMKADSEPIFYMDEDIYYPPNSRPLPTNNVKAAPFPEISSAITKQGHHRTGRRTHNRSFPGVHHGRRKQGGHGGHGRNDLKHQHHRHHHYRRHTKIVHDFRQESPPLPVLEERRAAEIEEDIVVIPDTARPLCITTHYGARTPYMGEDLSKTI
ncbi:hypothetical protein MAR_019640 [Mya arenaria]|uniref:Uncharacterized protein n=1 Tax=Mya arenaria TaxID=6604 RepID=A0ABY7EAT0_MYAAR|nr:hypothetical protein MAR_019640 [Mya arenaria]